MMTKENLPAKIEEFQTESNLELYNLIFVCFVCENEWLTSVPAIYNIVMVCPNCWNSSGMREDIIYRGFDTGH